MKEQYLTRQAEIIPIGSLGVPITIIGAGSIGSVTAITLAKMGLSNITVFDFDSVSEENMNCQWYRTSDIGKLKVDALRDLVKEMAGVEIIPVPRAYETGNFKGIVISAADSMAVRKSLYAQHKHSYQTKYFIDSRMAAEYGMLYCIRPWDSVDQTTYEKTLYSDDEAIQERCTAKATMYTSTLLSGLLCKTVKDILLTDHPLRVGIFDIKANTLTQWRHK